MFHIADELEAIATDKNVPATLSDIKQQERPGIAPPISNVEPGNSIYPIKHENATMDSASPSEFSVDGTVIGTVVRIGGASRPQTLLKLWSTVLGEYESNHLELPPEGKMLRTLAIGPQGSVIALLTKDTKLHIWHSSGKTMAHKLIENDDYSISYRDTMEFSKNGKFLAHHGHVTRIYSVAKMLQICEVDLGGSDLCYRAISTDGQYVAYVNRTVSSPPFSDPRLWSIKKKRHQDYMLARDPSPQGSYCTGDPAARGGGCVRLSKPLFSLDGRRICVVGTCGFRVWKLRSGQSCYNYNRDAALARNEEKYTFLMPAFSAGGRLLAGLDESMQSLTICNIATNRMTMQPLPAGVRCLEIAFGPHGHINIIGCLRSSSSQDTPKLTMMVLLDDGRIDVNIFLLN